MSDIVLDYLARLRSMEPSERMLGFIDELEAERRAEIVVVRSKCARCGEPALGYATIGRKQYCHADERSCYTEQHREDTWKSIRTRLWEESRE